MYTNSREAEVALMEKLWNGEEVLCPKCQGTVLVHLHNKAKKSDCDWKCTQCGEMYRTIRMLMELPEK